jgi:hypothetical protein
MLRFRHSPFVRTLALLLMLNLTLWSCASAPASPEEETAKKQAAGELVYQPVPVDSVLPEFKKKKPGYLMVQVTFTDSAMVSLDGAEPQFHGGERIVLWDMSSHADTLFGTGGPAGPGVKHSYVIPPSEIAVLEIVPHPEEGDAGPLIAFGIIATGALVALIAVLMSGYGSD